MKIAGNIVGVILLNLAAPNLAVAQGAATLNAETMTAAREFIAVMRFDTQPKAALPTMFQTMRPALVQGRYLVLTCAVAFVRMHRTIKVREQIKTCQYITG